MRTLLMQAIESFLDLAIDYIRKEKLWRPSAEKLYLNCMKAIYQLYASDKKKGTNESKEGDYRKILVFLFKKVEACIEARERTQEKISFLDRRYNGSQFFSTLAQSYNNLLTIYFHKNKSYKKANLNNSVIIGGDLKGQVQTEFRNKPYENLFFKKDNEELNQIEESKLLKKLNGLFANYITYGNSQISDISTGMTIWKIVSRKIENQKLPDEQKTRYESLQTGLMPEESEKDEDSITTTSQSQIESTEL